MLSDGKALIEELERFLSEGGEPLEPMKVVRETIMGIFYWRETWYLPRDGDPSDPYVVLEQGRIST